MSAPAQPQPPVRRRLAARGLVQGVGCRPFIFRLASELGLAGWVRNHSAGVTIEVEGPPATLDAFVDKLVENFPVPGRLEELTTATVPATGEVGFRIVASEASGAALAWVLPDLALCPDCRRELLDPGDRRYGYAFLNCTHCGPRFTIIRDVPYDRAHTTMAAFALCDACRAEYEDPHDRRFHAQPTACAACGPRLSLAVATAADGLRAGRILAVKGLGGYHLAVDATNDAAVARLRERKQREARPLAVMVLDLAGARALGTVSDHEAELLASPAAPIVLLDRRADAPLAESVAPGQTTVGVLLAYTPLHVLLLRAVGRPLVMTSGNLSDEPIAHRDEDAAARLGGLADLFLAHDRPIERRCDDSVLRAWRGRTLFIRRSRGYAPAPLRLAPGGPSVLAVGGHQKNTFCLTRGSEAFLSHHVGDLENAAALAAFETGIADFERLFDLRPERLACDLHPDYLATRYAHQRAAREGLPLTEVQHHHAHIAACLADNERADEVLGLAFDGTGYGPDGTIWGGEALLADRRGYRRVARVRPFALAGGEAAVRQGWRVALDLARQAACDFEPGVDPAQASAVRQMLAGGFRCVTTSSAGRLFDGFSALCGVAAVSRYEGEAAVRLEGCAVDDGEALPFDVARVGELWELDWRPAVAAALQSHARGVSPAALAGRFHRGLAAAATRLCDELGAATVALGGGCWQNVRLLSLVVDGLSARGHEVLTHRRVSPNDGGLSWGQAACVLAE